MSHNDVESAELRAGRWLASPSPGQQVVVAGLAGMYAESDNVYQLRDNLMNKVDMITRDNRRWNVDDYPEVPSRSGKLLTINKFDAAFFGIQPRQAELMDPMGRILLEKTYEAIVDAGVNPADLAGTTTGVFIGSCFSENECRFYRDDAPTLDCGLRTSSRITYSERISYWLKCHGPCVGVDTACSSGTYAIDQAYQAMRDGICDQAIVGAANLCGTPQMTRQFYQLGILGMDGKCMSFDEDAQGYARSEAIVVVFLQKAQVAKRNYATIMHSKTNCDGYKNLGITFPSEKLQQKLLQDFYQECRVDPASLEWLEAHGTGTAVGDPEECSAVDAVFCKNRKSPLLIGSVKSNLGHSEPASGLCSLTKIIIAMETGVIPPNLHFKTAKKAIPALTSGRFQVVTEPQPWNGGLVAFNSFGFGGANAHILLKWNEKTKKDGGAPIDKIPRLVTISGRTEQAVKQVLDDLASRPVDAEYVRLYHDVHSKNIPGHWYRGYTILKQGQVIQDIQYTDKVDRPLWLIFSGLDSQWGKIGRELQVIPVFAAAMKACHQALLPQGVDVLRIIAEDKPKNQFEKFVGITALQIGLLEVLKTVGVQPAGLIGHSLGELAAAYADNCLTIEQAMLTSYFLGLTVQETETIRGAMVHIDKGHRTVQAVLTPEIDVACRDSVNSCVVSGPAKDVSLLVNLLKKQDIKNKMLESNDIALHSRYITSIRTNIIKHLQKVIPTPKARSGLWTSSSVVDTSPACELSKMASAEYFANILLSPVLFEDALKKVPKNAILVEISPSTMLRDTLKNVPNHSLMVSLLDRSEDATDHLLLALGKMYNSGVTLQLAGLYPNIAFPVSRGTPMLSPLVGWEHSKDAFVIFDYNHMLQMSRESFVRIDFTRLENQFYFGHAIDGRILFPGTGYIWTVAEAFTKMGSFHYDANLVFENIRFHRATNLISKGSLELVVSIQMLSGHFEVVENGVPIVTGRIYIPDDIEKEMIELDPPKLEPGSEDRELSAKDVYKEARLHGYNYSGLFRSIQSSTSKGERAKIKWADNWVVFMDNMTQLTILAVDSRGLFLPTGIDKLSINRNMHSAYVASQTSEGEDTILDAFVHREARIIRSGGIEIRGLNVSAVNRRKYFGSPVLESYQIVPYRISETTSLNVEEILRLCVHVALENQLCLRVKSVELVDEETCPEKQLLSPEIPLILRDLPYMQAEVSVLSSSEHPLTSELGTEISVKDSPLSDEKDCMFVLGTNLLDRSELLQTALSCIGDNGFLISREVKVTTATDHGLQVLCDYRVDNERILLLKKISDDTPIQVIHIKESNFDWISTIQEILTTKLSVRRTIIVAQGEPTNGIIGLFTCLRKESVALNLRCFSILDASAPAFDPELPLYKEQIAKDLAVNVYKDGQWGSYRHLRLADNPMISVKHAYANTLTRGDLSSFRWLEGSLDPKNLNHGDKQELIHVYYSALNFRDVMISTGKLAVEVVAMKRLEQDCVQGLEFSGRTMNGTRVMGMVASGSMSNMVLGDKDLLWEIPDDWSLEDAATVPVVYGTALYALHLIGHMTPGESVLIHSGTGGVGQAAINIALHEGCTVFTTVGTQEKRDYIKQRFPQLTDRHIGNSRDTSFEQLVMAETNGRGVDLVLNSLAEEKLRASVRCLAVGGRFLEIGKFDLANNNPLDMNMFLKETSFHGVMLDFLFTADSSSKKPIYDIVANGIKSGAVRPLQSTIFPSEEVEQAFRYMGAGKHIGKVLIKIRSEEEMKTCVPEVLAMDALPRFFCNPRHTYIIAGGLGGLGLELADWLVLRGARKLVLTSRTGISNGYQSSRVNTWRSYGATILVSTADATTEAGVTLLLQEANRLGPVAAIFNLAVVLADELLENQTAESFAKSFGPKAIATSHLDTLSRRLCPQLSHFVVFSSVSCGRGTAGQTNYGMANSVMERICEKRVSEGYPGLAVQWGAVGDVGLVAEMQEDHREFAIGGTLPQRIASCLQVFDGFLRQPHAVVASMVVAEKKVGGAGANMVECVANILGIQDLKKVSFQTTLAELGMDSMTAVEIKQTLEREYQVFLTPQELRVLTFARVAELMEAGAVDLPDHSNDDAKSLMALLFQSIEDEVSASVPVKILPSLVDDSNHDQPTLFMIPGIEGLATTLQPLATNLKYKTVALQYGYTEHTVSDTLQQMVDSLFQHVTSSLAPNEEFFLLGYSYGSLLALHLTRLLEEAGHRGRVFLVDGAPDYLQQILALYVGGDDADDKLQMALLSWLIHVMTPNDREAADKLCRDVSQLSTWDERVDFSISLLPDTGHSSEYLKNVVSSGLNRFNTVSTFSWPEGTKLQSHLTLLRQKDVTLSDEAYGLGKYCEMPPDVVMIEANHRTILQATLSADFINSQLATQ